MTEMLEEPMTPPYSVGSAIAYGWKKFEASAGKIMLYGFLLLLPPIAAIAAGYGVFLGTASYEDVVNSYGTTTTNIHPVAAGGIALAVAFVFVALYVIAINIGLVNASIKVLDNKPFSFGDLVSGRRLGSVLMSFVLIGLGTAVGLVLCIIPGIVFAYMTRFSLWFILDGDEGPVQSIKSSLNFTKNHFGPTFLFWIVELVLIGVGETACYIGLLVAMPIAQIGTGYTYRRLQNLPISEA